MQLSRLFEDAVRRPHLLREAEVDACIAQLIDAREDLPTLDMGARAILAISYARPELLGQSAIDWLHGVVQADLPPTTASLVSDILQGLMPTSLGPPIVCLVEDLLADGSLPDWARSVLLDYLDHVALWRRDLLHVPALIALCECTHLDAVAQRILTLVVEPCVLARPSQLDDDLACRLAALLERSSYPPYLFAYLEAVPDVRPSVRAIARATTRGRFPLAESAGDRIRNDRHHILFVYNVDDAQGDEIVRVAPFLQAMLDCNPCIRVTLLTKRRYLYAHPRVDLIEVDQIPAVHAVFQRDFDILINFFHPTLNFGPGLERLVLEYYRTRRPFLFVGCSESTEEYVFDRLEIDGHPHSEERGLHGVRMRNVYETTFRLTVEMGLPLRLGEISTDVPLLAGVPCPQADALWRAIMEDNTHGRPVAVLNPFGGHEALKGYVDRTMGNLVQRIQGLIADGFFVLVLPNGEPWGTADRVDSVLALLDPVERHHAAAAPDMLERGGSARCGCIDIPLQWRSMVMRHYLHFLRKADLIVAVEGWAIHAAYVLGKRFRVLTLPYSVPIPWLPYGSTERQVIADFQVPTSPTGLSDAALEPPLEELPRRELLLGVVRALGQCPQLDVCEPLLRALQSPVRHVRIEAVRALADVHDDRTNPVLVKRLRDACSEVRGGAAQILLDRGVDLRSELGPGYHNQLRAHVLIAEETADWHPLLRMHDDSRIPLEMALHDDYGSIKRRAREIVRIKDFYRDTEPIKIETGRGKNILRRLPRVPSTLVYSTEHDTCPSILIVTPLKDVDDCLDRYCSLLARLSYPRGKLSLGLLESDSRDPTYVSIRRKLPELRRYFRNVGLWKHDFSYRIPTGFVRSDIAIQMDRRRILAESRNYLLSRALQDEDWVLWIDADVVEYPADVIERLLACEKPVVTPNCVVTYGGSSFDRNAWRDRGALHMENLRGEGDVVPLHGVGGTMLLVKADLHRKGLNFPPYLYGAGSPLSREPVGEIETEGLGIMAYDMGASCWGMPNLEIRHRDL